MFLFLYLFYTPNSPSASAISAVFFSVPRLYLLQADSSQISRRSYKPAITTFFLKPANFLKYSGKLILPWLSKSTSMAPPSIRRENARESALPIGSLESFTANPCQASLEYKNRQLSSPLVTTAPSFNKERNLAGTAILPLSSKL